MKSFWEFSTSIYSKPGVEQACLMVQSTGMNVNIALWIVWTGLYGRDPGPALGQAIHHSALWEWQVVQPLRQSRHNLKRAPDYSDSLQSQALRASVLENELEAERLEQLSLEQLSRTCPEHGLENIRALISDCFECYANRLNISPAPKKFLEIVFSALKIV